MLPLLSKCFYCAFSCYLWVYVHIFIIRLLIILPSYWKSFALLIQSGLLAHRQRITGIFYECNIYVLCNVRQNAKRHTKNPIQPHRLHYKSVSRKTQCYIWMRRLVLLETRNSEVKFYVVFHSYQNIYLAISKHAWSQQYRESIISFCVVISTESARHLNKRCTVRYHIINSLLIINCLIMYKF